MHDLIIIGAGPYGLAAAAEARKEKLDYLLIGRPMNFWLKSMPGFMLLRSPFIASSIYSPDSSLSLKNYYRETGREIQRRKPVPLAIYLKYIDWYVKKAGLHIREEEVVHISREGSAAFTVTTGTGEILRAKTVIMAVGNPSFATIPEQLRGVERKYFSHTVDLPEFSSLAKKKVLVVGGGQSAIEACWGLIQAGAEVELTHRQKKLVWHNIPLRINIPLLHFFVAFPTVLELVPWPVRKLVGDMVSEPTVDKWLRPKVESKITEYAGTVISTVEEVPGGVKVLFADGRETVVEHLVLGTGYGVDVKKLSLLDPGIVNTLEIRDGYPVISGNLESSIAGLFFTGVLAKGRFGPTFNFIFASPAGAKRVIKGVRHRVG